MINVMCCLLAFHNRHEPNITKHTHTLENKRAIYIYIYIYRRICNQQKQHANCMYVRVEKLIHSRSLSNFSPSLFLLSSICEKYYHN